MLSPADWQTARGWRDQGIPVRVVIGALESVFERLRERGRKRRVSSLAYCRRAVEEAWQEIGNLMSAGVHPEPTPIDVGERLEALTSALPAGLALSDEIGGVLAGLEGPAEKVERALQVLDRRMLDLARAELGEAMWAEIRGRARRALERRRSGSPESEASLVLSRLCREFLRRQLELPTLSLFTSAPGSSHES